MYEFRWPTRTLVGRGLIERVDEYASPVGHCRVTAAGGSAGGVGSAKRDDVEVLARQAFVIR